MINSALPAFDSSDITPPTSNSRIGSRFFGRSGSRIGHNQVSKKEVSQRLLDAAQAGNDLMVDSLLSEFSIYIGKEFKGVVLIKATEQKQVSIVKRLLRESLSDDDINRAYKIANENAMYFQEMNEIESLILVHKSATRTSSRANDHALDLLPLPPNTGAVSDMDIDLKAARKHRKCTLI